MEMTDKEIAYRFERNDRDSDYIKILAQLNGTNTITITDILKTQGYYLDSKHQWQKRKKFEDDFMSTKKSVHSDNKSKTRKVRATITQNTINLIVNLYKAGYSKQEIAKEADVCTMTVDRYIKKLDIKRNSDNKSENNSKNPELLNKILSPIDNMIVDLETQLESLKQARAKIVEALND